MAETINNNSDIDDVNTIEANSVEVSDDAAALTDATDDALGAVERVERAAHQLQDEMVQPVDDPEAAAEDKPDQPVPAPPTAQTVAAVDDDLADNDALFDSDFDAVEDVLSQVFETKAALVQHGESTTISVRTPAKLETPVEESIASDEAAVAEVAVEDVAAERAAADDELNSDILEEATAAVVEEEIVATADAEVTAVEAVADEVAEEEIEDDVFEAPVEVAEPVIASVESKPVAPVEPSKPVVNEVEKPTEKVKSAKPVKEKKLRGNPLEPLIDFVKQLGGIFSFIKPALVIINAPLKFVPAPLRPLVDYFALTLIMWVPIVWAIAWLMRK